MANVGHHKVLILLIALTADDEALRAQPWTALTTDFDREPQIPRNTKSSTAKTADGQHAIVKHHGIDASSPWVGPWDSRDAVLAALSGFQLDEQKELAD